MITLASGKLSIYTVIKGKNSTHYPCIVLVTIPEILLKHPHKDHMIAIQYMSGSYAWVTSTSSYQTPTSKTLLKNMNYVKAEAILKEGGTGNAECKIGKGGKGRKEKSVNAKRKGKGVSRKKEIIDDIINDEVAEVEGEEVLELRNRIIAASRIYGELELIRTGWYKDQDLVTLQDACAADKKEPISGLTGYEHTAWQLNLNRETDYFNRRS